MGIIFQGNTPTRLQTPEGGAGIQEPSGNPFYQHNLIHAWKKKSSWQMSGISNWSPTLKWSYDFPNSDYYIQGLVPHYPSYDWLAAVKSSDNIMRFYNQKGSITSSNNILGNSIFQMSSYDGKPNCYIASATSGMSTFMIYQYNSNTRALMASVSIPSSMYGNWYVIPDPYNRGIWACRGYVSNNTTQYVKQLSAKLYPFNKDGVLQSTPIVDVVDYPNGYDWEYIRQSCIQVKLITLMLDSRMVHAIAFVSKNNYDGDWLEDEDGLIYIKLLILDDQVNAAYFHATDHNEGIFIRKSDIQKICGVQHPYMHLGSIQFCLTTNNDIYGSWRIGGAIMLTYTNYAFATFSTDITWYNTIKRENLRTLDFTYGTAGAILELPYTPGNGTVYMYALSPANNNSRLSIVAALSSGGNTVANMYSLPSCASLDFSQGYVYSPDGTIVFAGKWNSKVNLYGLYFPGADTSNMNNNSNDKVRFRASINPKSVTSVNI